VELFGDSHEAAQLAKFHANLHRISARLHIDIGTERLEGPASPAASA